MPFVPATIEIKPASVGTGIKASLRSGKNAPAKLTIFLSMRIASELGYGEGDGIEILLGDGEQHGLIRVRKNNSKAQAKLIKKATGKAEFLMLQLGHQAAFVDRNETGQWCRHEAVEDGWTEIVLPKWADETAPIAIKKAVTAQAPREPYKSPTVEAARTERRGPGRPPAPKQNVTADLMGDPPAGRREMLERIGKIKA